jgi:cytochrome c peroxidase
MASAARTFTRAVARANVRPAARSTRFAVPAQTFRAAGRRGYASEAGAGKSSSSLYWGIGLAAAGGAGYYFYSNGDVSAKATGPFVPAKEDYQKVYNEIARILVEKDDYDDGSYGPVRLPLACVVKV